MHVLITNNTLEQEAGSECSTRDVALGLLERGHQVSAFSCQLGEFADRLAERGVRVYADLGDMEEPPDIIHGHHEWETSLAALRWPGSPVLSFRRGIDPWQESPCRAPWISYWVGVDRPCVRHLREVDGVPEGRTKLLLNGVRTDRIARRDSLPPRPGRALVLSNYANDGNYLKAIREVCGVEGIECDAIGRGVGNHRTDVHDVLRGYDLVFAKGRAALEAVVAGCAVVVCDHGGIGELVTQENFETLRERSFYYDCELEPVTAERVRARLAQWQPADSTRLSGIARDSSSLAANLDQLEAIYREAIDIHSPPGPGEIAAFASSFLSDKGLAYKLGREIQLLYRGEKDSAAPGDAKEATTEWGRCLNLYRKGRAAALERERESESQPPEAKGRRRWLRKG